MSLSLLSLIQNLQTSRKKIHAQITMEFLIMLAVLLILAIVTMGFYIIFIDFTNAMDVKSSSDFWKTQARPFSIDDAFYEKYNGHIYFAIKSNSDNNFIINGIKLNNTNYSFFKYEHGVIEGASESYCDVVSCVSSPCICELEIPSHSTKTIFTETYSVPSIVCPSGVKYIYLDLVLQYKSESTNMNYTQTGVYPLALECVYRFNA